jgi:hypothetical protein
MYSTGDRRALHLKKLKKLIFFYFKEAPVPQPLEQQRGAQQREGHPPTIQPGQGAAGTFQAVPHPEGVVLTLLSEVILHKYWWSCRIFQQCTVQSVIITPTTSTFFFYRSPYDVLPNLRTFTYTCDYH